MFQIGTIDRQYIIDHRYYQIGKLKELLIDKNIQKVGHNLKFEYKHILHNYGIRINNIYDTQIVEQILHCGLEDVGFGLKDLIERYLNLEIDKETRLQFLKIKDKPFTKEQMFYGAKDILYPLQIKELQQIEIEVKELKNTVNLEMEFISVLGDVEYKGMYFDKNAWLDIYNKKLPLLKAQQRKLNSFVESKYFNTKFVSNQLDLFSPRGCNIEWSSSKQTVEFFKYLKACPQEFSKQTKKLEYTVNATLLLSSLNTINKDKPDFIKDFIKDYIFYKELEQATTTFGEKFFKYINPITKRIHSDYWQILATGRISSKNPNLQNIPSELDYRKCFTCPVNSVIVNADYSGQEQIVLANKANEPNLIEFYNSGQDDMHSYIASKIWADKLSSLSLKEIKKQYPELRQIAKAAGFAINYGGTGFTIAKNLGIPEEQGNSVYEAYFKAFPKLKQYFSLVQNAAIRKGYILIDEITNRKSYFEKPNTPKETHAIYKKALNYPIQGSSGSMTKYATILFRRWILENNYQDYIYITNIIHDEINVECIDSYAEITKENLEKCMLKASQKWCTIVPMKATAVITNFWGH